MMCIELNFKAPLGAIVAGLASRIHGVVVGTQKNASNARKPYLLRHGDTSTYLPVVMMVVVEQI
ncbi:hypothetical protein DPMN_146745, partial [Dreissena polymorpha]